MSVGRRGQFCVQAYLKALQHCYSEKDRVLTDIYQINVLNGGLQSCQLPSNSCQSEWPITALFFFKHLWEGHVCHRGHKTTFRSPFSSTMWVLRIKFRTQAWAISQALHSNFWCYTSQRQVLEGSFPFLLGKLSGKHIHSQEYVHNFRGSQAWKNPNSKLWEVGLY